MTSEIWVAVITGACGLLGGSALTAWAKWPIEKRRIERQRRYQLLDSWRSGLTTMAIDAPVNEYLRTAWYETLRPHISDEQRERLERPRTFFVSGDNGRGLKDLFTGEIDRIERDWDC